MWGGVQVQEEGFGFVAVHGAGEEKALDLVAAEVAEGLELGFVFYAFGYDFHAEGVGHADDVFYDGSVSFRGGDAFDEEAVDFEGVEGELAQAAEGGVAGAEVVDGDADAEVAELAEMALGEAEVLHEGGFRNFELNGIGWRVVLAEGEDDGFGEVFAGELDT